MSPKEQLVNNLLWFAHPILQTAVAVIMVRRALHRSFPVFFQYLLAQILIFAVEYSVYTAGSYRWYFYAYWAGSAVSVFLGFKVIHEIFLDVFRPYHTLKDLGSVLFKWAGLVMLLVAVVVAFSSPANNSPLTQSIFTTERCVRVIQCGLVFFLLAFCRYLGISWRQHSFGISLGFGAFASIELGIVALGVGSHISAATADLTNMAAYNIAIIIWLGYLAVKSPARENAANLLRPQRWEQSLNDIQHPATSDSLIPLFEGMVDRALSRTNSAMQNYAAGQSSQAGSSFSESSHFGYGPPPSISSKI
jgi:hypothetical protein